MATAMIPRQRTATPERWQAALRRAIDDGGVQVRQLAGSGQWIATSGSRAGVAYAVSLTDCECEAALLGGDPVCRHRAALAHRFGALDLDPEPPSPAAPAVPVYQCPTCRDSGSVTKVNAIHPDLTYQAACRDCRTVVDLTPFLAAKYGRGRATA